VLSIACHALRADAFGTAVVVTGVQHAILRMPNEARLEDFTMMSNVFRVARGPVGHGFGACVKPALVSPIRSAAGGAAVALQVSTTLLTPDRDETNARTRRTSPDSRRATTLMPVRQSGGCRPRRASPTVV
jgi:hypothetical protein